MNNISEYSTESGGLVGLNWQGDRESLAFTSEEIQKLFLDFNSAIIAIREGEEIGFTSDGGRICADGRESNIIAIIPPINFSQLGDPRFCQTYQVRAPYFAGGMANGISSEQMVVALGRAGLMGSFGSGGLSLERIQTAIQTIQSSLGDAPYAFNLLHNPFDPEMEQATVELYLREKVKIVEAAAYIRVTPALVQYRAAGLSRSASGEIDIENRVIAKLSRREVAAIFLDPASEKILIDLVATGKISPEQAEMARQVPLADDITVEADSGGHTDNQPLVSLLPSIIAQRNQSQMKNNFPMPVRIGAAGGISTPESLLGAYMMGAAFVVTGSINQSCVESGASEHTRKLLSQAAMADVSMAPSADMFELGSRVQVLRKGSMFPMRAQKLYDLYISYETIEEIPQNIREELEERVFKRKIDQIWQDTVAFFEERNPAQIAKAKLDPKKKMALVFRWYLGLASRWSRDGIEDRKMDYQIWCGPSMGAFNEWSAGTYMENYANRQVADVAWQLLKGCLYRYRLQSIKTQGAHFPANLDGYPPQTRISNVT